jgi:hypothetical protein
MKKALKKFIATCCVLTMVLGPHAQVAAQEVVGNTEYIELVPVVVGGGRNTRAYTDTTDVTVMPGEIVYFISKDSNQPFFMLPGIHYNIVVSFNDDSFKYFHYGVSVAPNAPVSYTPPIGGNWTAFGYPLKVSVAGYYMMFFQNLYLTPVTISEITIAIAGE